ncbi:MAG: M56 family metallopeptidase, partial [Acidobacteriota bacterium]
ARAACRRVTVLESEAVPGPATFGVLRPVVLLPAGFVDAHGAVEQRHMLLHELAHIRRWDPMWLLLSQLLVATHWFNPVLWWAQRHFHVDLEAACDATVLRFLDAPERSRYGRTLLEVGAHPPVAALSPAFAVSSKHQLTRRIVMISRFQSSSPLRIVLLLALAVGLVAVTLTEIPSALASPDIVVVQARASDLADQVAETFISTEGTPASRAHHIAGIIEKSRLKTPAITSALVTRAQRAEEAGQNKLAAQLRHTAAVVTQEELGRKIAPELQLSIQAVRNAGTMMFRRIPQARFGGEAPGGAYRGLGKPVMDWNACPAVDHSVVQEAVGVDLDLPKKDGWGYALAYCLEVDAEAPLLRIGVRSPGSDGRFDDEYTMGSFSSADTAQDVVWINGYFARWPES